MRFEIKIGKYIVSESLFDINNIHIGKDDGEGGDFSRDQFEKHILNSITEFYDKEL